jgi:3-oxoacyl-[acyl-carrier protein] reductase
VDGSTQFNRRVVLVTGASRGIGAEVARQLSSANTHVVINYREKVKRAQAIADEIITAGGCASILGADLSKEAAVVGMVRQVAEVFGRLDVLVLNASGGLERGADPGYAMRINRDAQMRLARLALPLMPVGARIVFVTSHQAHFHGQMPVPDDYLPISQSKRAGEDALRAMQPAFSAHGVSLVVVSGDMIDGTMIVRLLARRDPDAVAARRSHGDLPTIDEFAGAIVQAANAPLEAGQTIYVGGRDYLNSSTNAHSP